MFKKIFKNQKGFTLVEILVVIVIIGILFTVILPRIDFASDKARQTGVKTDFRTFDIAAEQLMRESAGENLELLNMNTFLDEQMKLAGVTALNSKVNVPALKTITLNSNKKDPWGIPYSVTVSDQPGANASVVVKSSGKTGTVDYTLAIYYKKGVIDMCTLGFDAGDILLSAFTITAGGPCGNTITP